MRIARIQLACALAAAAGAAGAQGYIGSFQGTEKVVVTSCGTYNSTSTGPWSVTHSDLQGNRYAIQGRNATDTWSGSGEIDASGSTTKVEGVSSNGSRWRATSTGTVDGDRLTLKVTGQVLGSTCRFTSEVEATRVKTEPAR